MSKMRHWRQRWDPEAELVFLRRLRMGDDPERPFVLPGDPVTSEIRTKLGTHRLRRWWDAGAVGLANWQSPGQQAEDQPDTKPPRRKHRKKVIPTLQEAPTEG
jgi:hypothetical protein